MINWFWNFLGWTKKPCCGIWEMNSSYTPIPKPCKCELDEYLRIHGKSFYDGIDLSRKDNDDTYSAPFIY